MKLSVVFSAVSFAAFVFEDNEPTFSPSLFSCAENVYSVSPPPLLPSPKSLINGFPLSPPSLSTLQRSFSSAFAQKKSSRDQSGVGAVLSRTMASFYESAHWWEGSALNFVSKLNCALEIEIFFGWTQLQVGASLIFIGKSPGLNSSRELTYFSPGPLQLLLPNCCCFLNYFSPAKRVFHTRECAWKTPIMASPNRKQPSSSFFDGK